MTVVLSVRRVRQLRRAKIEKRGEREAKQRGGEEQHRLFELRQFQRLSRHRIPMEEVVAHAIEMLVDLARDVGRNWSFFLLVEEDYAVARLQFPP